MIVMYAITNATAAVREAIVNATDTLGVFSFFNEYILGVGIWITSV